MQEVGNPLKFQHRGGLEMTAKKALQASGKFIPSLCRQFKVFHRVKIEIKQLQDILFRLCIGRKIYCEIIKLNPGLQNDGNIFAFRYPFLAQCN